MASILDEIVVARKQQLQAQKAAEPETEIRANLKSSDRDFAAALRSDRPSFILECKKASPSKGLIRDPFDLNEIAATYRNYASAISVLTEPEYFQGSFENLRILRSLVDQPIICKDFIVDPYQVFLARYSGADAILLILAILDDDQWRELFKLATSLGMDSITEISNQAEQQRAINLNAPIVGINNRDLRDMSIDLQTTRRLATGLSDNATVISESGYYTNRQVRSMVDCSHGYLIGSSIMGQPNLESAVRSIIFGENKVCGLTRNEDAKAADQAGAVFGGVILTKNSPRCVDVADIQRIFEGTSLVRVGVVQDQPVDHIISSASEGGLDVLQLHGNESREFAVQLMEGLQSKQLDHVRLWRAMPVTACNQLDNWLSARIERFVIDHHSGQSKGGTGECFDWSALPQDHRDKMIIAGGIGPDNVQEAMRLGCCGVDMNSKLEDKPGIKSSASIQVAFERIRNYGEATNG